jgi:hypothetical protein
MRLDMHSRREILKANFEEYQRASKKGRKELLDRLVPVTGLNRSYLATALGSYDRDKEAAKPGTKGKRKARPDGKRGGRPRKYGEEFAGVFFSKKCSVGGARFFVHHYIFHHRRAQNGAAARALQDSDEGTAERRRHGKQ